MIPGLDGLRALAYLVVFFYHIDYLYFGWMGVQLFFVLSGFLITDILLRMKEALPMGSYFYKFYVRRFLRIFPLYYFFLSLLLGISFLFLAMSYRPALMGILQDQLPFAYLYIYNFYTVFDAYQPSPFMDHLWSLSVEEQFYLVWPLLIFLVREKWLKALFLAGIAAGPLFRTALFIANEIGAATYLRDSFAGALYALPFTHMDAFAFGAYISRYSFPHAKKMLVWLGLLLPAAGFLSHFLGTGEAAPPTSLGFLVSMPHGYQFLWAYSFINLWFALLIHCVVKEKFFVHFLEHPLLRYLGKISYGLYIYHFPIIWFSARLRDVPGLEILKPAEIYLIAFFATIAISAISYHLLESPLIRLKDRLAAYSRSAEKHASMR